MDNFFYFSLTKLEIPTFSKSSKKWKIISQNIYLKELVTMQASKILHSNYKLVRIRTKVEKFWSKLGGREYRQPYSRYPKSNLKLSLKLSN